MHTWSSQINSIVDILGVPASKEMQIQGKKKKKREKRIQLIKMMSCSALIAARLIPAWVQVFLSTQFPASKVGLEKEGEWEVQQG